MMVSIPPALVKSSTSSRWPYWKTQTTTPSDAPSETTLSSNAFSGTSSEPVIANSSANVASTTMPIAHGASADVASTKSTRPAAWPVTQVSNSGRSERRAATTSVAVSEFGSGSDTRTSSTVYSPTLVGGSTARTPSMSATSCDHSATSSTPASATTRTAGAVV